MSKQAKYGGPGLVAKRYYDPEDRRQRRVGQGQAVLGGAGAAGMVYGGRKMSQETKNARKQVAWVKNLTPAQKSRLFAVSGKNAAAFLGGAAALGGATQLTRHVNSNRGRGWN